MTWEQFSALDDGAKIDEWHIETSKHARSRTCFSRA